ncbi:MAG: MarR family winged helix-turn-helix transcriptional regulator [Candidatus Acidiferrales bacterium]
MILLRFAPPLKRRPTKTLGFSDSVKPLTQDLLVPSIPAPGKGAQGQNLLQPEYMYMHLSGMSDRPTLPNLPCLCASFRRASRALTQAYEVAIRPLGIRATQLTILQVLARAGDLPQGKLGEILAMDSTSLTRTLAIMKRHGWIAYRRGEDRRERWAGLAPAGKAQLRRVEPAWEKVQSQLRSRLGDKKWKDFLDLTHEIASVATTQGGSL